ncbi:uncharacterized protein M421DRAFT_72378 [Didymella exigua CBS 183.55]|uniref:Transcription factor domain-containing protein n=1 Tax=Didymella exigua CBS 183.55 TaxID=1150837 RepID=A0A6A5R9I9_9PLEO|nr:uncharacterized protein M421DRAFT_72378 [Didymella exigua CBS 183.55]KAF1924412.1 hypothetical protein M421DRAFT_72378 [Didymella exigua CBS 183.55]
MQQSSESASRSRSEKSFPDIAYIPHQRHGSFSRSIRRSTELLAVGHDEAVLFNHFAVHLGRWLDCTNASRVFTLNVLDLFRLCPILYQAVLCFAARHRREDEVAEKAYHRCINLLIVRLKDGFVGHDDMLLSAVLILHFADQLNVPSRMNSRDKQHLEGTSSILRASQTSKLIDPSASTLRDAAFWVYVRQILYNASIYQQPLDIDFSLQLYPVPKLMRSMHPLDWLRLETAWANQMLWHTACIANFCFAGVGTPIEPAARAHRWNELSEAIQIWDKERPTVFDPIGSGLYEDGGVFPEIWFTADWHVISYIFFHFSSILLLRYKAGAKFAIHFVRGDISPADRQILRHIRAICSACRSARQNPQLMIVLSHTVFIWGPLLSVPQEQDEVVNLLESFEQTHAWRTSWIVELLKEQWNKAEVISLSTRK